MSTTEAQQTSAEAVLPSRPKRADACRNYDKVITAAREAFSERGASTSLEEIARRAEVGIGTLYRNFPNRQALLEAVYYDEVQTVGSAVDEFAGLAPWDALAGWLHRVVSYMQTKQALAHELFDYVDPKAPLFMQCRSILFEAGQPLLDRAQEAGAVRTDTNLPEIVALVGGIAKIHGVEPDQIHHILDIALDGLRPRA